MGFLVQYCTKFLGGNGNLAPVPSLQVMVSTFIGSFLGIGTAALLHFLLLTNDGYSSLIGSFGATAVLLYACPESPLAQPWNCFVGHFLSAIVGITVSVIHISCCDRESTLWLAATIAVTVSITVMQVTRSIHPPGGATALLAVTANRTDVWSGYLWVFLPTVTGAVVLLIVAVLVNNAFPARQFPQHWQTPFSKQKNVPVPPSKTVEVLSPTSASELLETKRGSSDRMCLRIDEAHGEDTELVKREP